jgi:hypothetical protein
MPRPLFYTKMGYFGIFGAPTEPTKNSSAVAVSGEVYSEAIRANNLPKAGAINKKDITLSSYLISAFNLQA